MKKIKIKGCARNMSTAVPVTAAIVTALALFALRTWQLAKNTDLATGFFHEKDALVYVFYILAVAGALAVCVLCYLCGRIPEGEIAPVKRPVSAVASVFLATSFGYEALSVFETLQEAAEITGLSLYDACTVNGTFRELVSCVLCFVSMLAFVLYAVSCLTGKYAWLKYPGVLFLAAPLWGILRVISYFSYTVSYLVTAELFCELYAAVFLMLFLFSMARFITGTSVEGGAWALYASGLTSFMFCVLASAPRMVTDMSGIGLVNGFGPEPIFAAGAVFALVSMLSAVRKGMVVKAEEEKEESNESEEDGDIPVSPFTVE